jgi:hypothetical protein
VLWFLPSHGCVEWADALAAVALDPRARARARAGVVARTDAVSWDRTVDAASRWPHR